MTALTEFLFPAPARRTVGGIVRWWESRRLAYNAIVGGTGVVTLVWGHLLIWLPPNGETGFVPWQVIVLYGVMANVCYSFGSVLEVIVDKLFGRELLPIGPGLFRIGLTFSVGLTLFPLMMITIFWVVRVLVGVLG